MSEQGGGTVADQALRKIQQFEAELLEAQVLRQTHRIPGLPGDPESGLLREETPALLQSAPLPSGTEEPLPWYAL